MDAQGYHSPHGRSRRVIFLLVATLVGLAGGALAQTTIYVDCSNSDCVNADGSQANPFCTIQEGINAAADGDTVIVAPCTYTENIDFLGKTISVKSASGADVTVIDGGGNGSVVQIQGGSGPGTLLEGFTIRNGQAPAGGGILIGGTATPTLRSNTITGNRGTSEGGGVSCQGSSSPSFEANLITLNSSSYSGGGVHLANGTSGTFLNNTVTANRSDGFNGGGIYGAISSQLAITGGTISGNTAGYRGGGVGAYGSLEISDAIVSANTASAPAGGLLATAGLMMTRCQVDSNVSGGGGGVVCQDATIIDSQITNNTATRSGGGVNVSGFNKTVTLINNLIWNNSTTETGGGVFCNTENRLVVSNCDIVGNSAANAGGLSATFEVSNSIVWGNSPDALGGTGTVVYSDIQGGFTGTGNIDADPLFADEAGGDFHLTLASPCHNAGTNSDTNLQATDFEGDARIFDGIVDMGMDEVNALATLYVDCVNPDCASADGSQAMPFCTIQAAIDAAEDGDTIFVSPCTYLENIDFLGKTIEVLSTDGADLTIIDGGGTGSVVQIVGNEGIGTLLEGFTLRNGQAQRGGGLFIAGSAAPTIRSNTISGNSAQLWGGGVSCQDSSSPTFSGNIIASNQTYYGGGGVEFNSSGVGSFSNDTITSNSVTSNQYGYGGGLYVVYGSSLTFTGGTISGNTTRFGGGIQNNGTVILSQTTIEENQASVRGGGVFSNSRATTALSESRVSLNASRFGGGLSTAGTTQVLDSRIDGNQAEDGGGIEILSGTSSLINTTIDGNSATGTSGGGGCWQHNTGVIHILNSTLVYNSSASSGGALQGAFDVSNSILWGNSPDQVSAGTAVTYSDIQGGHGGTGNIDADPLFEDPLAGDYHLSLGSPCVNAGNNSDPDLPATDFEGDARILDSIVDMGVDEFACAGVPAFLFVDGASGGCPGSGTELDPYCSIQMAIDNSCSGDTITVAPGTYYENLNFKGRDLILQSTAGASRTIISGSGIGPVVRLEYGADATVNGFTLRDGYHVNGGGIVCRSSSPTLINCVVANCQAQLNGGAMYCRSADPTLLNVTFTQNVAGAVGGAIYSTNSSSVVATNSILWGNTPDAVSGDAATITYSDVEGGYVGTGNIDLDPELLDPANGDFRLSCASPCIDAGTDAVALLATDFEGDPRQVDGDSDGSSQPDMGADEFDELFVFFDVLGSLTGFLAQAPPASIGDTGFVLISMGDGASGGVPLPYGEVIGLDLDPLLNGWLLAIPSVFRTVTVQGCPGTATGLLEVPSGFSGFSGYYAGFFTDGATSFRATPTKRFILP